MKRNHVLIMVQNLPVPLDRRVWMEATTLRTAGSKVSIVCPSTKTHPKFHETIEDIEIYRYPLLLEGRGFISTLLEYIWSLVCFVLFCTVLSFKNAFNVVHICNPPDLLFIPALIVKLTCRAQIFYDQHDLVPELWLAKRATNRSSLVFKVLLLLEKATYAVATKVIVPNTSYQKIANLRGNKELSEIYVVRSAPKRSFMYSQAKPIRDCSQRASLVYLGTMGSQEGIEDLIEACSLLRDSNRNLEFRLDLIGDGPERKSLESLSQKLNLKEIVRFRGRVEDEILREIIFNADIAINPDRPSILNDLSSMNKIVEYMALGTPIIQYASTEGLVTTGGASLDLEIKNSQALHVAIQTLLDNRELRQEMSRSGLKRFNEFLCWEMQSDSLLKCYFDSDVAV